LERVGLIHHVVEQLGRMDIEARRRQRGWSGRDAEVIQYFHHNLRRGDQGQQDHLGLASGTLEAGDAEASHQQTRPRQPSGSDRGRVRHCVIRGAGLKGGARGCRRADVTARIERRAGLSQGKVGLLSVLCLVALEIGAAAVGARVGVIVSGACGGGLRRQRKQGAKSTAVCEHAVVTGQILVRSREIRRRTKVVGCFPDGRSALMLVAARLRHIAGTKWGTKKYLDISLLSRQEVEIEHAAQSLSDSSGMEANATR